VERASEEVRSLQAQLSQENLSHEECAVQLKEKLEEIDQLRYEISSRNNVEQALNQELEELRKVTSKLQYYY
jgi:hypothetical protein